MSEGTSALDTLVEAMLEGIRDGRVARAVREHLLADLRAALDAGFVARFRERLGDAAEELGDFPDEVVESAEVAFAWIADERPQFRDLATEAVALEVGAFIDGHRDAILDAMRQAGEGPAGDRVERMAKVESLMTEVEGHEAALDALPARSDEASVDAILQPVVGLLEQARDLLEEVALDDGILGVPEGAVAARERLREAWLAEVDLYLSAVDKVGRPLDQSDAATFEQQTYLLDAIVALQEALTLRVAAPDLLRLARLRLAKGDVGEARSLIERVKEIGEDEALLEEAEALGEKVSAVSPLGRDKRCFIATAALGEDAPELETLRAWRDDVLFRSRGGRAAISAYYRVSPPIARAIRGSSAARAAVRTVVVRPLAALADAWMRRTLR